MKGATQSAQPLHRHHPDFNPRSREGSDLLLAPPFRCVSHFNPRSREGSDLAPSLFRLLRLNFNPRSREGSDQLDTVAFRGGLISIHAPVKGATPQAKPDSKTDMISIHAPVKGATGRRTDLFLHTDHFNPRSREGSDRHVDDGLGPPVDFNPRSREGSDLTVSHPSTQSLKFQSTLP